MAKLVVVLALTLCAAIGTIGDEVDKVDCSQKFTCNSANPGYFVMRNTNFRCEPKDNICNIHPVDNTCKPCVPKSQLCDKFFKCVDGNSSQVIINGITGDCPTGYNCNNEGEDSDCAPCIQAKCPAEEKKSWRCLNESTAVQNWQIIQCSDDGMCNSDNVAPCDQPCVPRDNDAKNYISLLRELSVSVASPRG